MAIPISSSQTSLNAALFLQEGFELSLDSIVPSIELTGSFTPFASKTEFYIYDSSKNIIHSSLDYQAVGSYLHPEEGTSTSLNASSSYNQFEYNPVEDVYNQGFSFGTFYAIYNFIDYELGSEIKESPLSPTTVGVNELLEPTQYDGHPYFIKDISGDRTELRIQNNFLSETQITNYYNQFTTKLNARNDADEFYVGLGNNRNFIGVNTELEVPQSGSTDPTSILIKLYAPLPPEYEINQSLSIITKVGESTAYKIEFNNNLSFTDSLLSLKGPNYNIDFKERINNSTNFKNLDALQNPTSNSGSFFVPQSSSLYQFNTLQDNDGIFLSLNYGDWSQFIKYSSAEQRLNNFYDKMVSIESASSEIASLDTITGNTSGSSVYSSSLGLIGNRINDIISKFDSYEYYLYYLKEENSWPKLTPKGSPTLYPYPNYSVTSSQLKNWFGTTNEIGQYYNTGKNQIYSASRYDNDNQDYLYYLIPPFITDSTNNNQYVKFINMTGQAFDEMFMYTEAIEQVRNTNSPLTGSVLPLQLADEVIESFGFDTFGNNFNSIGFNPNNIGVLPSAGSGEEFITRYIDIAQSSIINYYDQNETTLGYLVNLADPAYPYAIDNAGQEIYKRIFHNMISLVKRKGTVTGLRQLINIWGVPNTMLRISEFGGKNKDDENDYDLWMNRYTSAYNSFNVKNPAPDVSTGSFTTVSSNATFPWLPLYGNYVENNSEKVAVPDCIQFRFKTARTADATSNFSESVLLKRGGMGGAVLSGTAGAESRNGDFGIYLHQSGSQSGSYPGAIDSHYNTYASMSFVISGSTSDGATSYNGGAAHCFVTDPIYLPFYNKEWWTVQIQRKTHLSASNENNNFNEYELRVGQNIYEGYDGNEIGWVGSSSLEMTGTLPSSSMNEAWNKFYMLDDTASLEQITQYVNSQVILPGNLFPNPLPTTTSSVNKVGNGNEFPMYPAIEGFDLGDTMSGSFQEFRYYRRAISGSAFNDLIMNPESIQGHADSNTGAGSSYDLLSYRVPLGNELEFIEPNGSASQFDGTTGILPVPSLLQFVYGQLQPKASSPYGDFGGNSVGSVHPSAVNYVQTSSLFTGSFFNIHFPYLSASSQPIIQPYALNYRLNATASSAISSSYISPNNEINYMDQPSAGIRNRIKNKIAVIDGNEYGTTLSPFRTIQQEFEQSGSYTEDLNSLEVGFSFQNEVNDDIIATFGHGVVSDAIADPRFISESSDRYPELTRIADDYFKKYEGFTHNTPLYDNGLPTLIEQEYDYNRLIKFYETSLFRAIKAYVPARTSLSTGVIVKQHLLERNKTDAIVAFNINSAIAITPETGSDSWGYTNQTGFNSVISNKNLLISSSIGMYSLTGSAGGSINKYNNLGVNTLNFNPTQPILKLNETDNIALSPIVGINLLGFTPTINAVTNNMSFSNENGGFFETFVAYEGQLAYDFTIAFGANADIDIEIRSDKRGVISTFTVPINNFGAVLKKFSPVFNIYPNEKIKIFATDDASGVVIDQFTFEIGVNNVSPLIPLPNNNNHLLLAASASQQSYFATDNFTGNIIAKDTQDEFYNGEYSGSNVPMIPTQYNPYRIFADGNDQTPDTVPPSVDFTLGGGNPAYWNVISANTIEIKTGYTPLNLYEYWTGSFQNIQIGETYVLNYTVSNLTGGSPKGIVLADRAVPPNQNWNVFQSIGANGTFNVTFTATDNSIPGTLDNGGVYFRSTAAGHTVTIKFNSITGVGGLGPKHFYPRDSFTIIPSQSQLFQNSPYNPIINNVSSSRKNSFFFDQDFAPPTPGQDLREGIPTDYQLLVSASQLGKQGFTTTDDLLEYAPVPDSNYTARAMILPRYSGSRLYSADYNFYTGIPSQSKLPAGIIGLANPSYLLTQNKVQYINGETGSWQGDDSYGKTAVIDRNPINFAHFKQSYENLSVFNTTTFIIDQLIQVPFEEILSEQSPIITSSLINGSNENLIPVSTTFTPTRKTSILYNNPTKTFAEFGNNYILNYDNIPVGSKLNVAGATHFQTYFTNQLTIDTNTTESIWSNPIWNKYNTNYTPQINAVVSWATNGGGPVEFGLPIGTWANWDGSGAPVVPMSANPFLYSLEPSNTYENNITASMAQQIFQTASYSTSVYAESKGLGKLNLKGPWTKLGIGRIGNIGPAYAMYNSINKNTAIGDMNPTQSVINPVANYLPGIQSSYGRKINYGSLGGIIAAKERIGSFPMVANSQGSYYMTSSLNISGFSYNYSIPVIEDTESSTNYFNYNMSASNLHNYEQINDTKLQIEVGDEIRISYGFNPPSTSTIPNTLAAPQEVITQDFQVIEYEQYPPAVVTSPKTIPNSNFTLNVPSLITSSEAIYAENPFQIDEYKRRMDIAILNTTCFSLMDYVNTASVSAGTGSFFTDASLTNYVVNNDGENRPTEVQLTVDYSKFRKPTENVTGANGWVIMTNNKGINLHSFLNFGTAGYDDLQSAYENAPSTTDSESQPLSIPWDPSFMWDKLLVNPNPRTLLKPIPSGSIMSATLRKRQEDDTKVVLQVNQPSGSLGVQTVSGDGYLIPDDLTPIQQRNIQKLINKLKSENVFTQDSPPTQGV